MKTKQETKELNLKEKVDKIYNDLENPKMKNKKLRCLRKAKVSKSKLKKGYVGVYRLDENGNLSGEKVKISDSSFKLKNGTYHATDGREIIWMNGKYPIIFQKSWKEQPINFFKEEDTNETYGQKYVMAKMMADTIKVKKSGGIGGIAIIAIVAIVGYILYKAFTGGL